MSCKASAAHLYRLIVRLPASVLALLHWFLVLCMYLLLGLLNMLFPAHCSILSHLAHAARAPLVYSLTPPRMLEPLPGLDGVSLFWALPNLLSRPPSLLYLPSISSPVLISADTFWYLVPALEGFSCSHHPKSFSGATE